MQGILRKVSLSQNFWTVMYKCSKARKISAMMLVQFEFVMSSVSFQMIC